MKYVWNQFEVSRKEISHKGRGKKIVQSKVNNSNKQIIQKILRINNK